MLEEKIIILEDDLVFRSRLSKAFKERGLNSVEAASINDLRERLSQESFDYAVIDLKLENESGIDALELIQSTQPDCKSVMLTGFGTISTTVEAMRLGAVHYLTKPADPDTILDALSGGREGPQELPLPTLAQREWEHIQSVMKACDGNISQAAKTLGMHRRSLQRKLKRGPGELL